MPKLLTANEVAELLNVHRTTLQRWARAGYFPRPTYLGRKAYYDPKQVDQFISNQRDKVTNIEQRLPEQRQGTP